MSSLTASQLLGEVTAHLTAALVEVGGGWDQTRGGKWPTQACWVLFSA